MISVSTTYNNIISGGGHYEWQVLNGSNTWSKSNIISGSISSILFDGVSIGNTISSQLDIQLWNVTVDTSSPLVVQFRATNGSSNSTWYTKGTFFIDTLETSPYSEDTKITAFDAMLKAEYPYQVSGTWEETTDLIVLNRIASDIGVAVDSATTTLFSNNPRTLSASPNIGSDGTTEREMLSYIGAMRGGNWIIDASNKLKLIILSTAPTNTANIGDAVSDFDAAPIETVKRVKVWISDDTYYAFPELPLQTHVPENIQTESLQDILVRAWQFPDEWDNVGGRVIDVSIPFFCTYSIAKAIYTQFVNKTYQPYNTNKAFIQPEYEVGDGIIVKNITSIIANQSIDISALAPSSVELRKDEAINSLYPYKEPFKRKTDYQVAKNTQQIATNTAQIAENTEKVNAIPSLIDQQTTLITGGFGGYIKYTYLGDGTPSEMLIMDTPDESTATNIIRLNRNGIGFSTDGGQTYGTAWTIDGKFNANYIQTGTIADDLATPNNYWDLTTGRFVTTNGKIGNYDIIGGNLIYEGDYERVRYSIDSLLLSTFDGINEQQEIQISPQGISMSFNPSATDIYDQGYSGAKIGYISYNGFTDRGLAFIANNGQTQSEEYVFSINPSSITTAKPFTVYTDAEIQGNLTVNSHSILEVH